MNKDFSCAFYVQIKISTLQDRILRTRESGPLISKARDPCETTRILNVLLKVFGCVDFRFEIGSKYNEIIVKFADSETFDLLTCSG